MSDPITELMPNAFLIMLKESNKRLIQKIYLLTKISVENNLIIQKPGKTLLYAVLGLY